MTTKTEQIIADNITQDTPDVFISELRRLSALCAAYWREIEWCRCRTVPTWHSDVEEREKITAATDAARREAGEGQ